MNFDVALIGGGLTLKIIKHVKIIKNVKKEHPKNDNDNNNNNKDNETLKAFYVSVGAQ